MTLFALSESVVRKEVELETLEPVVLSPIHRAIFTSSYILYVSIFAGFAPIPGPGAAKQAVEQNTPTPSLPAVTTVAPPQEKLASQVN